MAQAEPLAIEFEALKTAVDEVRQGRRGAAADALLARVGLAFGPTGMGVLLVHGVPEYARLRQELLPYSSRLAQLPEEEKAAIVVGAAPARHAAQPQPTAVPAGAAKRLQGGCKEAARRPQGGCKEACRPAWHLGGWWVWSKS